MRTTDFASECSFDTYDHRESVKALMGATLPQLYAEAVSRGAEYYRSFAGTAKRTLDLAQVPHEALGCSLLAGPEIGTTFASMRVGAMVLSDLHNDPELMAVFATEFHVTFRLMALAEIAIREGDEVGFWQAVRQALKQQGCYCTDSFGPGVSRLVSKPGYKWLRTDYTHPFVGLRIAV